MRGLMRMRRPSGTRLVLPGGKPGSLTRDGREWEIRPAGGDQLAVLAAGRSMLALPT